MVYEDSTNRLWFRADDMCRIMNHKDAYKYLVDDMRIKWGELKRQYRLYDKPIGTNAIYLPEETEFVSESGLRVLTAHNQNPEAVNFAIWVFKDALPEIRHAIKSYKYNGAMTQPAKDLEIQRLKMELIRMQKENDILQHELEHSRMEIKYDTLKYQLALVRSAKEMTIQKRNEYALALSDVLHNEGMDTDESLLGKRSSTGASTVDALEKMSKQEAAIAHACTDIEYNC